MRTASRWLRIALAARALALGVVVAPGLAAAQDDAQPPAAVSDDDAAHDDAAPDEDAPQNAPAKPAKHAPAHAPKHGKDAKPESTDESAAPDEQPAPDPTAESEGDDPRTLWHKRAEKARAAVEKGHARVAASLAAYQNMRQRNFPRGDAAAAIEKEVVDADKALKDAEAALARLEEDARSAAVPAQWIEPDSD